jgi:hypothetical protein
MEDRCVDVAGVLTGQRYRTQCGHMGESLVDKWHQWRIRRCHVAQTWAAMWHPWLVHFFSYAKIMEFEVLNS